MSWSVRMNSRSRRNEVLASNPALRVPISPFETGIPCWNCASLLVAVRQHLCRPPPELLGQRDVEFRIDKDLS